MVVNAPCKSYVLGHGVDLLAVARHVDRALVEHFNGRKVVLRAVSSSEHEMSQDDLVSEISETGTDRYDTDRIGDRYENINNEHIDFFGRTCTVRKDNKLSLPLLEGFHIYGPEYTGKSARRMDLWLVYDRQTVKAVPHQYSGAAKIKRDGYVFRDQHHKKEALIGVIVV